MGAIIDTIILGVGLVAGWWLRGKKDKIKNIFKLKF